MLQSFVPAGAVPALEVLLSQARAASSDALGLSWKGRRQVWAFGGQPRPIETMSVTKSVVGLVIGRAATLGLIDSIETPVHEYFPEWRQGRKRDVTLRMLLEHTSGLQNVPMTTEEIYPSRDFVQLALSAELETAPGESYAYNNKAVNLLAGVIEHATGRKLDDFARDELFTPLGVERFTWQRDPAGNPHAMSGLALQPEDLLAVGELVATRGAWNGEQLISDSWFGAMDATAVGEESALLWWHVHDVRIDLTAAHLEALEQAGAPSGVTDRLSPFAGSYRSMLTFYSALNFALGTDWRNLLPEGVKPFSVETGDRIGYRAEGDLGQHLYVFPQEQLVVVRQLSEATAVSEEPTLLEPPSNKEEHMRKIERLFFSDFEELALTFRDALKGY